MSETIQLSMLVDLSADAAEPPTRFRIFRAGENATTKGIFVFDADAASAVLSAYDERGVELPIDYDHAMASADTRPSDRVAAGWFRPEVVEGELWASDVRWTPRARQQLADREWRYMSPWFLAAREAPRRVLRLLNVALTNVPATNRLDPIVAHDAPEEGMQTMASTTPDTGTQAVTLAALTGAADEATAHQLIREWREKAERLSEVERERDALSAQLSAIEKARIDEKAAGIIEKALSDRRLTPATAEKARAVYASHGIEALSAIVEIAAPIITSAATPPSEDAVALSDEDKAFMAQYGISEAAMIKAKRDEFARGKAV